MKGSAKGWPQPVNVHLVGGCHKRRRHAWTEDPAVVTCPKCLATKRWRRAARRVIRQLSQPTLV